MLSIAAFRRRIWEYYTQHGRVLPWRETTTPYAIIVSEVMLQQTQVSRVLLKFPQFMNAFPTWEVLAKASYAEVLRQWQGLGYNRRALSLKAIAERVVGDWRGTVPNDSTALLSLPGIGPATAASIRVFAWNEPMVFIETNIRSVFIHHFFPQEKEVHDTQLLPIITETLDHRRPRQWYWALMDYGTWLKSITTNPSRLSAHHIRQLPFKGSRRALRGQILRELITRDRVTIRTLSQCTAVPAETLKPLLDTLMKEGFVERKKGWYMIVT